MAKAPSVLSKLAGILNAQKQAASAIRKDLDNLESEVIDLRLQLAKTESAPVDSDTIAARVNALIAGAMADAHESFGFAAIARPDFSMAQVFLSHQPLPRAAVFGLACAIGDADAIRERLIAKISPEASGGMTDDQRTADVTRLTREIADRERIIEQIHREAEANGVSIPRRVDSDPAALLAPDQEG